MRIPVAVALLLVGCGTDSKPASSAAGIVPACVQQMPTAELMFTTSNASGDSNALTASFKGTEEGGFAYSRGTKTTRLDFQSNEKPCLALRISLGGPPPTVGVTYPIGTSSEGEVDVQYEELQRCRDLDGSRTWKATNGTLIFSSVASEQFEARLELKMEPHAPPKGGLGTFTLAATLRSNCFVETK